MDKKEYILEKLEKAGISADERDAERLLLYAQMLVKANERVNLTAITDFEEIVEKHFIDSLAPLSKNVSRETFEKNEVKIVDVGTGAGFPGLPLAILLPNARVYLIDALQKRVDFLNETISALGLENTTALHSRAEDAARAPEYRENFDICVSRAVADLAVLAEYSLPFVRKNGIFVAYKAKNIDEELDGANAAIETLGGKIKQIEEVELPKEGIKRKLVIIEKIKETPEKYPRKAGKPEKKPIRSME